VHERVHKRRVGGPLPGIFAGVGRSGRWALAALGAAAVLAGCGESHHRNDLRPAEPITVTALIDGHRVKVSPTKFGAGPIMLLVSNQSGRPQHLTFQTNETGGGPPGIRASTPVPLHGTAQLQVSPKRGSYVVAVHDHAVRSASVRVGAARRSSQDQLLRP
jgi:hypothetical protein